MRTQIDPVTLLAYQRTEYRVDADWSLWVDQPSQALAAWHSRHGVNCSGFITAVNPRSRVLDEPGNRRRDRHLRAWLEAEGLRFLTAAGVDPDGNWPEEPGFLIAGIDQETAARLGRRYDQNAVIWSGPDAVPRLILLR